MNAKHLDAIIGTKDRAETGDVVRHETQVRKELVVVERTVNSSTNVHAKPTDHVVNRNQPLWQTNTQTYEVPVARVKKVYRDVPVETKQVIDEYVVVPVETGEEVVFEPEVTVVEREVEVKRPRLKMQQKIKHVPEIFETVRYVETDDNTERVVRYVPKGYNLEAHDAAEPHMDSEALGAQRPDEATAPQSVYDCDLPLIVDVPIPFVVPKPVCVSIDVPLIKFDDNFVPVPVRRHVTPKLTFTSEVYAVPCIREKPILVVEDKWVPVPVNVHLGIREENIEVKPIDPSTISQADMHAMWMRAGADQLDLYKRRNEGKLPRGMRVPEELKVSAKPSDWETVLQEEETQDEGSAEHDELNLGPLPIDENNPLIATWQQAQFLNTPTTQLRELYSPDAFRMHYAALGHAVLPKANSINLTQTQAAKLGPNHDQELPHPWNNITQLKQQAMRDAFARRNVVNDSVSRPVESAS